MNRGKVFLKNLIWELGYYAFVIVLGFLAPRLIILTYGSEVNGLSSTITQVLNILLLLQSGATTAAVYSLFKPVSNYDMLVVSNKVEAANRYFKKISIVFVVGSIIAAVIFSKYLDSSIGDFDLFLAFVMMGGKSFLDLFLISKYRIVFTAFQKRYIISIATLIEQIIYYLLVFVTIYYKWNFVLLYVWYLLGVLIKAIVLICTFKKTIGKQLPKPTANETADISNKSYAMINEISHSVTAASITILISVMYGLKEGSVYSVYALVGSTIGLVLTAIYSSFQPSLGNIVASESNEVVKKMFGMFRFGFNAVSTLLYMCVAFLIIPFVNIYAAGVQDIVYENWLLALLVSLHGICSAYRIPYNTLVSSCGFFKETWLQPTICAGISIILSVSLGYNNFALILIGPTVFYVVNFLYQHFRMQKLLPGLVTNDVIDQFLISIAGITLSFMASTKISFSMGIFSWFCVALLFLSVAFICIILVYFICFHRNMENIVTYIKSILKKR